MDPIYLDYNATTPIARDVADTMKPYLYEFFGNPSSSHSYGLKTHMAVDQARRQCADLIGADPQEIVFTSGGTEANNYAIRGVCLANRAKGNRIITSAIEHPAVMEVCKALQKEGFQLTILEVDHYGQVNPADLAAVIDDKTLLVTIMHANNEVGTIQKIQELAEIAHQQGAVFHSDAAQSTGKIPVNVNDLGVDLLSIAGHKLYAPKGIGFLYVRSGLQLEKLMQGASHESNRRPGTENVLEIVGLGKAAEIAARDLKENMHHYQEMRDHLAEGLMGNLGDDLMRVNGHPEDRLPNTLSVSFKNVEANTLLAKIGDRIAASAGAACHADQVDVSQVLQAMKVPLEWAMGTVRLSVGRETTDEQIDTAVKVISADVKKLQRAT
jgi:cysteine desulfurase